MSSRRKRDGIASRQKDKAGFLERLPRSTRNWFLLSYVLYILSEMGAAKTLDAGSISDLPPHSRAPPDRHLFASHLTPRLRSLALIIPKAPFAKLLASERKSKADMASPKAPKDISAWAMASVSGPSAEDDDASDDGAPAAGQSSVKPDEGEMDWSRLGELLKRGSRTDRIAELVKLRSVASSGRQSTFLCFSQSSGHPEIDLL